MWQQLFGAQSTIETHAQKWNVGNGNQKCFRGLAGKCSSRSIGNCTAYHYWNVEISFFLYFINCEKCGFCVQSIENGFYQKNIHAAVNQGFGLLFVGNAQLFKRNGTKTGIVYVGTHTCGFVCGADSAGYETRFLWFF